MHIYIVAVGTRMPDWVAAGFREYAKRMPAHLRLELIEVAAARRQKGADVARLLEQEGQRLLQSIPRNCHVIALDRVGDRIDTRGLAGEMRAWMSLGSNVALLIGGPEGLSAGCLEQARQRWSLSPLTLAHPVVRVVLAEQLYRAWSILENRPYHRG
jgi:23S rRNA (pseudouridine1915-N3)-methyltransferase